MCLTFCPDSSLDRFGAIKDIHLYIRKILLKSLNGKKQNPESGQTNQDMQALNNQISLLEESEPENPIHSVDIEAQLAAVDDTASMQLQTFIKK